MPMPATFISYASAAFHGYATYYSSDIQPVFASVNDPALQSQLSTAVAAATTAMNNLATYIDGKRPAMLFLTGGNDSPEVLESHHLLAAHLRENGSDVEERTYAKVGHMGIMVALAPGFRNLAQRSCMTIQLEMNPAAPSAKPVNILDRWKQGRVRSA